METANELVYESEDTEPLEGWALIEWKKGKRDVCQIKAVLVAGVWALRLLEAGREGYPLYKSSTSWNTIKMLSEDEARALLTKRQIHQRTGLGGESGAL
jgi:hypothetical protein